MSEFLEASFELVVFAIQAIIVAGIMSHVFPL